MTPGVLAARRADVDYAVHEYGHDPKAGSYGLEAAEKLGVDPAAVFKTLVIELDGGEAAVAVLPVLRNLDLKAAAAALGAKKARMGDPKKIQRITGYVLGGVSPLGQKKALRTVIDETARTLERIYVSGGRRGLDISLPPADLAGLTRAGYAAIGR